MHRSRIGVVLVDHPPQSYAAAATFWTTATGHQRSSTEPPPTDDPYESFGEIAASAELALQRTGDGTSPRVHLDIETDDVEAETARLVAAGGTVHEDRDDYVIMLDPGGLVFCVVPVQTADFAAHARVWD